MMSFDGKQRMALMRRGTARGIQMSASDLRNQRVRRTDDTGEHHHLPPSMSKVVIQQCAFRIGDPGVVQVHLHTEDRKLLTFGTHSDRDTALDRSRGLEKLTGGLDIGEDRITESEREDVAKRTGAGVAVGQQHERYVLELAGVVTVSLEWFCTRLGERCSRGVRR